MTSVTDVKPLASVIAYTDEETGYEMYQEVIGRTFMPLDAKLEDEPKDAPKRLTMPQMQTRYIHGVEWVVVGLVCLKTPLPGAAGGTCV